MACHHGVGVRVREASWDVCDQVGRNLGVEMGVSTQACTNMHKQNEVEGKASSSEVGCLNWSPRSVSSLLLETE